MLPTVTRPQLAVYAAAVVAVVLLGGRYLHQAQTATGGGGKPAGAPKSAPVRVDATGGGPATVQVVGAVRRPGLYRVRASGRVDDAVRRAGGATGKADLAGLNLAAKINDGQQIVVPAAGAVGSSATVSAPAAGAGGAAAAGVPGPPVNLNTATPEQLDQLDGVGPATAQKIVAYRQQHGGFRTVSELDQVPGIGAKKLAALKDRLRL